MKFNIYHSHSIIILLFLAPVILSAQSSKQANNWYFGEYAGLTFNTGSPPAVLLDGQINADMFRGTACISSHEGDLLFYSDGVTVWNNNHQVMVNGTNMGNATLQGGLFIKVPGSNDIYYFFNFSSDNSLHQLQYSVVDASLYGGSVVQEQKGIILQSNTSTHLNAVLHANGQDIWILTHESGTNYYYAFLITQNGISIPVNSFVGAGYSEAGYLKFSSDGKWVACANPNETGKSQLFRFNNQTGMLWTNFEMDLPSDAKGVEFSSDNKKLYVNGGSQHLRQYDLTTADPDLILLSEVIVSQNVSDYGAIQLGADGKIYLASSGNSLGVIHNPNEKGLMCNFEANAIDLTRNCRMSFPNFMQSYFSDPYFITAQHCFGMPTEFIIGNTEGIDSVHWEFNDLGNFPFDTSTLLNPSYTYSAPGTYYPELTVFSGFISKTVYDTVVIYPSPSPELGSDTLFCYGESINLLLDAGVGDQYFWNGSLTPGQGTFQVSSTGIYWVKVIENGCSGSDTIVIGSYPQPIIYYINVTHDICNTGSGTITVIPESGDPDDYWYSVDGGINFVQNGGFFTNLYPGIYVAWIRNEAGCVSGSMPIVIASIVCPENVVVFPDLTNTPQNEGMAVITPPGGGPYTVLVDGISRIVENDTITGLSQGSHSIVITNLAGMDFTFMVNIEGVVGLEENSDVDIFTIHQDNSSNSIYLDFGKVVLSGNAYAEIRTTNGRLLSVHSIQTPHTEISLADIPKGVYIITVLSDKGKRSIKFVR